jgi:CMP-N-acetylneuraminic acid synthetase/spore coat polysaccharide biosynthesis predicted glycosyltransferase SpsG
MHSDKTNVLVIIPARGGSKGIPRKNLRKMGDLPLIGHSICMTKASKWHPDVFVSSDDDEILSISHQLGASIVKRPTELAEDVTTLDPVVYDAFRRVTEQTGKKYDLIATVQPTSPLLRTESFDAAVDELRQRLDVDTVISAKSDSHLMWRHDLKGYAPMYAARVNRQQLPPTYRETGGFLICRSGIISRHGRIGNKVHLFELQTPESIDIDSFDDWHLCEYYLQRKKILFVVTGNKSVGLGHVHNTLVLANDMVKHSVMFLVDKDSRLAYDNIAQSNYNVRLQSCDNILDDIAALNPDVVVNDCLDTDMEYMHGVKAIASRVVNFEDLGPGATMADIVINAIYPENKRSLKHHYGPSFFCPRDEFLLLPEKVHSDKVTNVLVTFGGVDPSNYTHKVLDAIYDFCNQLNIRMTVMTGPGYTRHETIAHFKLAHIKSNVSNVAMEMYAADLAFTSAGRTTFELAIVGVPSIVLCHHEREMKHTFAGRQNGFHPLGLGTKVSKDTILACFKQLVGNTSERARMGQRMSRHRHKMLTGKERVIRLIEASVL